MNETKPWWQSKTVWFNVAATTLTTLETIIPQLASESHPLFYAGVAVIVALGNLYLRTRTVGAITK